MLVMSYNKASQPRTFGAGLANARRCWRRYTLTSASQPTAQPRSFKMQNIAIQKPELTQNEILEIEGQVTGFINYYYSIGHDMKLVGEVIYHFPFLYLGDEFMPATVAQNLEEMLAAGEKRFEMLQKVEPDLNHAVFSVNSITILNKHSVILTGNNNSFREDGSLISNEGVIYVVSNIPSKGWRITAMTSTPVNVKLELSEKNPIHM